MRKDEKILHEIYRQLYKASTPSADFDKLMEEAEINEWGQKVIPFMDHEIEENIYEEIITDILKSHRVSVGRRQLFRTTVALGCSPKFKPC
jgi:hypothetical protein